jgi:pilus assembly protein CpaF
MSLLERLEKQKTTKDVDQDVQNPVKTANSRVDKYAELKAKVHREIIDVINQEAGSNPELLADQDAYIRRTLEALIEANSVNIPRNERQQLVREIHDNVVGLGPLEPLLDDSEITEIMVNNAYQVYVERAGKIELSNTTFRDDEHVMQVINRIVSSVGRRVDESSPMVDARLPDGSRFNAIIPPLALNGPTMTIRKFSKKPFTVSDLVRFNSVSPKMMTFLDACVKGKMNIIVSGGTGSGKTTLLNVLSSYIPNDERIVTIEDAAELQLRQDHVVTLESRPPNLEGAGQVTIRDLVRNSLRMRPDRIIIGEVRSAETLDMLQAMNTGHDGSLTTAHANSPRELVSRLETMVLMAGMDLPVKAIREQISAGINVIVHQSRLKDGSRKVIKISEITGMEGDTVSMQDIFVYKQEGLDARGKLAGSFYATGVRPTFLDKLSSSGILVRDDWFTN